MIGILMHQKEENVTGKTIYESISIRIIGINARKEKYNLFLSKFTSKEMKNDI